MTAALIRLARNPGLRDQLGESARRYAAEVHAPAVVAARYLAVIQDAITRSADQDGRWLADAANALAELPGGGPDGLIERWASLRGRAHQAARSAETLAPATTQPRLRAA